MNLDPRTMLFSLTLVNALTVLTLFVLEEADAALYRAKQSGRNKVCCFDKNSEQG